MNRFGFVLVPVLMAWSATGLAFELLPGADADAGEEKAAVCAACHGPDGNSANPEWPKLAGQHAQYTYEQLLAYKSGERHDPVMLGQVAGLSDQDMKDLAAFYARQTVETGIADEDLVELGGNIYRGGNAENDVPSCAACHGPSGKGNPASGYPKLAGQHAQYTADQLRAYARGDRMGLGGMMHEISHRLTDDEIEAVSSFIEGLN